VLASAAGSDRVKQAWVISESAIARAGLAALITAHSDQWQVACAATLPLWAAPGLAAALPSPPPDALLLDLSSQDPDWPATLSAVETCPAPIVVLLEPWPAAAAELLRAGVVGLLSSDADGSAITAALEAAAAGLLVLPPELALELLAGSPGLARSLAGSLSQALSQREVEVLALLAKGLGNKAIARHLNLSEHTVKFHIGTLFAKLNVSSRTEAAIVGARLGLILL
jgi:two-component system, NarL family, response regulator YdfI